MADAKRYAQWIVSNADKKGSPEFETVAAAYRQARSMGSAPQPTSEDIQQRIAALKPEYGFGETISRGASRGFTRLGSTFGDVLPAMVASGLGFDEYAAEQMGEAAQTEQELARTNAPEFQSYKDVEGIGDALKFASQVGSEQLANLATAIVPGVGLGGLAARGAVGTAAQIAAKKAAGQMAGTYLGSYALNAPEVFQNVYEETGTMAPGASALFATASAALDSFLPASLMRTVPAPLKAGIVERLLARSGMDKGLLRSVTANVLKDTTGEAVTEAAQEGISIAAERFINEHPEAFGKEEWDRIMESAVQGGVGGGVFGIAGGAAERASERQQTAARAQNIQQIRGDRVAKEQRETDLGGQMELAGVPPPPPGTPATQPAATLPNVVNRNYVFQRGRQLGVIQSGKLENLTQTEQKAFDALYKAENERVLFAQAAAEAEVQGVPFDANKTLEELNPEERAILNTVAKQKPEDQEAMFTASGAPTKPFIAKEKEAAKAQKEAAAVVTAEEKAAAIRARQEAQRQAAAQKETDRLAKEQERKTAEARATGLAEVAPKEIDLLASSRPPLERVLGTDFIAKAQKDLDAAAAKQGKLQAGRPTATPVTPAPTPTAPSSVLPTDRASLRALIPGANVGLGIFAENGPLAGRDISDPAVAAQVKTDLEAAAQKYSGKNADAVEAFLKRPEFQAAPAQAKQPAPTQPTPTPTVEETSGQAQTVKAETQERQVGPETSAAPATGEPTTTAATAENLGLNFTPAPAGRRSVSKAKPLSAAATVKSEQLAEREPRAPTAEAPLTSEEAAAMYFRAYDPPSALRVMVAESTPAYTETETVPTKADAKNAVRWVRDNFPEDVAGAITEHAVDFQNVLSASKAATQNREKRNQIDEALTKKDESELAKQAKRTAAVDKKARPTIPAMVPKSVDKDTRAAMDLMLAKGEQETTALKADTAVSRATRPPEKAALEADIPTQIEEFLRRGGKIQYLGPQYKGEAFDESMRALVAKGNINAVLERLIATSKPEIAQVLRKIKSLGLKTKVVTGAVVEDHSGDYNAGTDTITLDPETGLNEHIFLHEVSHAALVHALANPELEVTKQFTEFFNSIKDRMGDAYGGQDLQEFAAELVSNPEFQALLKSIKAPRSDSLWERIMQAVAEFFGFRERQSAYDAGFKFVSDVLDVSGDQKADIADSIFYGPGKLNELGAEVAAATRGSQERLRDAVSNARTMGLRRAILGAVSLNDMDSMVGDELPIRELEIAVESKRGAIDQGIDRVSKIVRELMRVENKYSEQVKRMDRMAIDARRAGVDLLNPQFKPTPSKQAEYTRLLGVYNSLPAEVRNAYRLMREDLDRWLKQFTNLLASFLSPSAAQKLLKDFANMEGVIGYMPFMRYGEYWIEYTDPTTGERTPMAFESDAARAQAVSALKRQYPKLKIDSFMNIQNVKAPKDLPAASFISKTINEMRANKVSEDVVNEVYQQYYLMFPANSIMKQFTKAKLLPGMNEDMIRAYSDVAVKWVNKLANTEYNSKIVTALDRIQDVAGKEGKYSDDMNIQAVASSIEGQRESFLNLNYSPIARALTTGSYYLHILGSVASAVVNLTGLPFFVYPILGGRFGYGATMSTMTEAGSAAARGWGESWSKGKYKALYTSLNDRGLLQHTTAREALERSKTTGKELGGLTTKVIDLLSIPFNASERYMRATTAIAAYELARKGAPGQKPMSEAEAIEFAAKTVKDTHTAGMSEVSPEYFKNDFGRVILTFKKIGFQQATVIALAFHRAFLKSDLDPKVKDVARRQLLGIFGMSYAFLGTAGLPFYGAFSVLGRMLAALLSDDDDEPYDFNMQMREISGDFYDGLIAKALNIDLSKRAALASDILWRDDPLSVQNYGYARTLMMGLAGPMGNYAINAERAITEIERGNVERGIETLLPTFLSNGMKGYRYMTEGAETLDGDPIESDINVLNALGQMAGFAPADLADLQERRSAAKQYEAAVLARKQRILDGYNMARADGDPDMAREFQKQAAEFRRKYPGLMGTDTLQRSVRSREAAQEEMMRGIRISKSLQRDIEKRFKLGED